MFSSSLDILVKFWPSVFTQNVCSGNAPTLGLNKKPPNQSSYSFNHISQHLKLLLLIYVAVVEQTAVDGREFVFLEWMKSKAPENAISCSNWTNFTLCSSGCVCWDLMSTHTHTQSNRVKDSALLYLHTCLQLSWKWEQIKAWEICL